MSTLQVRRAHSVTRGETHTALLPNLGFIAVEIVLLALLLILAVIVKMHSGPLAGDVGFTLDLQHWVRPHKTVTDAIVMVSTVAWPIPSIITIAAISVLLLALRRWLDMAVVLFLDGLANGTNYLISMAVHRARPSDHGIYIAEHVKATYSFPSGHVLQGVVYFGFLLFLTFQLRQEHRWLWVIRVALLAFILSMGPSRILQGEHWPSDVLGALIYGIFWLLAGAYAYRWLAQRWPRLRGKAGPLPGTTSQPV